MQNGKTRSHRETLRKESKGEEIQAGNGIEVAFSETFKEMQRTLVSCKMEKGSMLRECQTRFVPTSTFGLSEICAGHRTIGNGQVCLIWKDNSVPEFPA